MVNQTKQTYLKRLLNWAKEHNLSVVEKHLTKPWGAFIRFDQKSTDKFLELYFPQMRIKINKSLPTTPKYLLIEPSKRLSWQYHHHRQEFWRIIEGPVGICLSPTDEEIKPKVVQTGDIIKIPTGIRHRIVGLNNWAIVAEIWQHTNPNNPSDEFDIVRVQDDFAGYKGDKYR